MTTNNKCFSDTVRARLVRYSMQYVLQTTYFEKALVEIPSESPRRDTLGRVQNSFIFPVFTSPLFRRQEPSWRNWTFLFKLYEFYKKKIKITPPTVFGEDFNHIISFSGIGRISSLSRFLKALYSLVNCSIFKSSNFFVDEAFHWLASTCEASTTALDSCL